MRLLLLFAKKRYLSISGIVISPVAGSELLANDTFAAWSGDNPTGWTLTGETGGTQEVTERDSGQAHADVKTVGGSANFFGAANLPQLHQSVIAAGVWYTITVVVSRRVSGTVLARDGSNGLSLNLTTPETYLYTGRSLGTAWVLQTSSGADITIDSASVKALSSMAKLLSHPLPYGDFSATLTIPIARFQGGVVFNYQDANNYVTLYYDRLDGRVHLVKYIAGTPTLVGSWLATYSAGAALIARRHKDGTIDVLYNGSVFASGLAATGLSGLYAGPFLSDASNVTIGRYTWDARSTT